MPLRAGDPGGKGAHDLGGCLIELTRDAQGGNRDLVQAWSNIPVLEDSHARTVVEFRPTGHDAVDLAVRRERPLTSLITFGKRIEPADEAPVELVLRCPELGRVDSIRATQLGEHSANILGKRGEERIGGRLPLLDARQCGVEDEPG